MHFAVNNSSRLKMDTFRNAFFAIKWFLALALVRVGLSLFSLEKMKRFLIRAEKMFPRQPMELYQLSHSLDTIEAMGHTLLGDKACLTQALTARWLLRRHGLPAKVMIGVAKEGSAPQKLKAHAWVNCAGHIVMGGEDSPARFTVLPAVDDYL